MCIIIVVDFTADIYLSANIIISKKFMPHPLLQDAHHSFVDDCEIIVDFNRQLLMPGWIPRRLGQLN